MRELVLPAGRTVEFPYGVGHSVCVCVCVRVKCVGRERFGTTKKDASRFCSSLIINWIPSNFHDLFDFSLQLFFFSFSQA